MSFDLASYRISVEGLRLLIVDLAECHDHIRDLCSEAPTATHRAELSSFGGDLDKLHRQAEISLSTLKAQLKADKATIKALATCYRKDHYPYVYSKKPAAPAPDPCPACDAWLIPWKDQSQPHTCDTTQKVSTPFDF